MADKIDQLKFGDTEYDISLPPDDPLNSQAKYGGTVIVISANDTVSYATTSMALTIQSWVASLLGLTTSTTITMNGITLSGSTFVSMSDFITAAKLYPERSRGIWFSIGRRYASSSYISSATQTPIDDKILTPLSTSVRYYAGDVAIITTASTSMLSWECWPISPRRHHPTFPTLSYVAGSGTSGSQLSQRWYVNYLYDAAYQPAHGMQLTVKVPYLSSSSSIVTILSLYGNSSSYYYPVYWDTNKTIVNTSVVPAGQIINLVFDNTITSTIYLTAGTAKSVTGAWIVKHETALFKHNITCSKSGSTSIYLQIISADATPCANLSSIGGTISKGISAKRMTGSGFSSVSGLLLSANYVSSGTTIYYLDTTGSAASVLANQGYSVSDTVIPL